MLVSISVAALFLREMVLPCSEQQTEALTSRLSSPLGFGPVSSWGSEVFTEIGTLAGTDGRFDYNQFNGQYTHAKLGRLRKIKQTDSVSSAGLEDMVLSALIKEQVEGLTPAAITLIPPRKFAVSNGHLCFHSFSLSILLLIIRPQYFTNCLKARSHVSLLGKFLRAKSVHSHKNWCD